MLSGTVFGAGLTSVGSSKRRGRLVDLSALVAVLLLLSSCASLPGASSEPPGVIKVGFIAERGGAYQSYGIPTYNATLMLVKQLNDRGGVTVGGKKYTMNLIACDSNSSVDQGVACARKLAQDDGVKFIIGGIAVLAQPIATVTDPLGVIFFSPGQNLEQDLARLKYAFLTGLSTPNKFVLIARQAKQVLTAQKLGSNVAILVGSEAYAPLVPRLVDELQKQGLTVVLNDRFDPKALDLTSSLIRVKAAKPDLVITGWIPPDLINLLKSNQTVNAAPLFFAWGGCAGLDDVVANQKLFGTIFSGADLDFPATQKQKDFVTQFTQFVQNDADAFKNPVNLTGITNATLDIDVIPLLAAAITKAGSATDTAKVATELTRTSIEGVQGTFGFTSDHTSNLGVSFCSRSLDTPGAKGTMFQPPIAP